MNNPPNIVVHSGTVEDWVVQNTALEDHIFHIHQIHFQVLEVNGQPVNDPAIRDTVDLPFWSGSGPYPSVKLRMDFRDPNIVGTFVYHCHILQHEDAGMMGAIQVLPSSGLASTTSCHGLRRQHYAQWKNYVDCECRRCLYGIFHAHGDGAVSNQRAQRRQPGNTHQRAGDVDHDGEWRLGRK